MDIQPTPTRCSQHDVPLAQDVPRLPPTAVCAPGSQRKSRHRLEQLLLLWSPSRIVGNFLVYREITERVNSRGRSVVEPSESQLRRDTDGWEAICGSLEWIRYTQHSSYDRSRSRAANPYPRDRRGRVELDLPMLHPRTLAPGAITRFHHGPTSPLRVYGVPKRMLLEFRILGAPCAITTSSTLSIVRVLEESKDFPTRLVPNGRPGCGKSFLLLQAIQYAHALADWIVIYIPRTKRFVDSSTPHSYSLATRTYLQPRAARETLSRIGRANTHHLEQLQTTTLIETGAAEESLAPAALDALMHELGSQTAFPVLLARDDFQALAGGSNYRDPQFKMIRPHHLGMPRLLLEYASGRRKLAGGLVLGALSRSDPQFPVSDQLADSLSLPVQYSPSPRSVRLRRSSQLAEYLDNEVVLEAYDPTLFDAEPDADLPAPDAATAAEVMSDEVSPEAEAEAEDADIVWTRWNVYESATSGTLSALVAVLSSLGRCNDSRTTISHVRHRCDPAGRVTHATDSGPDWPPLGMGARRNGNESSADEAYQGDEHDLTQTATRVTRSLPFHHRVVRPWFDDDNDMAVRITHAAQRRDGQSWAWWAHTQAEIESRLVIANTAALARRNTRLSFMLFHTYGPVVRIVPTKILADVYSSYRVYGRESHFLAVSHTRRASNGMTALPHAQYSICRKVYPLSTCLQAREAPSRNLRTVLSFTSSSARVRSRLSTVTIADDLSPQTLHPASGDSRCSVICSLLTFSSLSRTATISVQPANRLSRHFLQARHFTERGSQGLQLYWPSLLPFLSSLSSLSRSSSRSASLCPSEDSSFVDDTDKSDLPPRLLVYIQREDSASVWDTLRYSVNHRSALSLKRVYVLILHLYFHTRNIIMI
ncbi:mitochondrial ribosomal death-associated protein 3-domain-containing protein [Mycena amicta]|nr:mitochondrial ribosomal death-associated protein 3-domain-containing protein [Mycena amicta]